MQKRPSDIGTGYDHYRIIIGGSRALIENHQRHSICESSLYTNSTILTENTPNFFCLLRTDLKMTRLMRVLLTPGF